MKRETRIQIDRALEISDLRWVMSTPQGRRYVWRILGEGMAEIFGDTTHSDPLLVGRFLGCRALGHKIFAEVLEECPDEYLQMQREAMTKEKNEKTEQKAIDKEEMTHE